MNAANNASHDIGLLFDRTEDLNPKEEGLLVQMGILFQRNERSQTLPLSKHHVSATVSDAEKIVVVEAAGRSLGERVQGEG